VLLPGALLFAAVCSLNCLFLYAWEHPADTTRAHASTRWALRHLKSLSSLLIGASALIAFLNLRREPMPWAAPLPHACGLPVCCAVSAASLLLLHRFRRAIPPLRLRALADVVLLTPLPFMLLVRSGLVR